MTTQNNENQEPEYATIAKRHASAVSGLVSGFFTGLVDLCINLISYIIIKVSEALVEISFKGVPIFCPVPNAITVYNLMLTIGYGWLGAGAAAGTLELISFFLIDQSLQLWDGYTDNPKRYGVPFKIMIGAVVVVTLVIIGLVFSLEFGEGGHKVLAFFPVLSLAVFVGMGVKRWRERRESIQSVATDFTPVQPVRINPIDRGLQLRMLEVYEADPAVSVAKLSVLTGTNKTATLRALQDLQAKGVVDIQKLSKGQLVTLNGNAGAFREGAL